MLNQGIGTIYIILYGKEKEIKITLTLTLSPAMYFLFSNLQLMLFVGCILFRHKHKIWSSLHRKIDPGDEYTGATVIEPEKGLVNVIMI